MVALAEKSSWCCIVEQIQSSESGAEPAEVAGTDAAPGEWNSGDVIQIPLKQTEDVFGDFVPVFFYFHISICLISVQL